jgi:hypothetical protein
MDLTKEQEDMLIQILDRALQAVPLQEVLAKAQSELDDVEQRFFAEREVTEQAHAEAISALNIAYAPERNEKFAAVEAAKGAIGAIPPIKVKGKDKIG